jgi:glycosidase
MTIEPRYPSLLQINTRVWLRGLSRQAGKPLTLADIDEATIDGLARRGFDWIWLMSVWQTGLAGRAVSRGNPAWRAEFESALPDLVEADICGSGFAISGYTVSDALGGETALARLRERLARYGVRLMLDYVPNHTAPDHPWVKTHPEYYVRGDAEQFARAPENYLHLETDQGPRFLAHGRDPNYPGWPDTLQLNYGAPELQTARMNELTAIAGKCDGVRCDMAMLMLPEVFQRTWGIVAEPFWPKAIAAVRLTYPSFTFMAEAYWDMEWTLQQQGFDFCYDKRLYDRLRAGSVRSVREHLNAGLGYQDKLARFLENHDEPRAAATFPWPQQRAAAAIVFLSPGMRFFHQGQFEGAQVHLPTHLCRGPDEPINEAISAFYDRLLTVLKETDGFRNGDWSQILPTPAWQDNPSSDDFIVYEWSGKDGRRYLVVVNYSERRGQCYLTLPFLELRGRHVVLADLLGDEVYERDGTTLIGRGLYIDHAPWQVNVFEIRTTDTAAAVTPVLRE